MIWISHHPKSSSFYLQMTHVYFTHVKISILYRLNKQQLNHLLKTNKLTLNIDKSSLIKFGWHRDCNKENKLTIQTEDEKLQQKHIAKYLGAYFDNNLSRKIKTYWEMTNFNKWKTWITEENAWFLTRKTIEKYNWKYIYIKPFTEQIYCKSLGRSTKNIFN